jgi:hypothetical protein
MNNKILAVILALGIITSVGYFGVSSVLADDDNPVHASLITKIAQKFNLKEEDVKAVFESVRDEQREQMKKDREDRLSKAVEDGVITQSQKESLISKMEENFEKRKENREEMQNWFKEQGIDELKLREYLKPDMKDGRHGRGMGRM